jgi:hypothetical protein
MTTRWTTSAAFLAAGTAPEIGTSVLLSSHGAGQRQNARGWLRDGAPSP